MFDGLSGTAINPASATWEYVDRLKKLTRMKLLLKGIETREDARLAREHGVDGIIVSNHGGRATEDLRPTIESLPEVVDAAGSQIPVLVDGGIRRGTDAYKALAMGARAVGIGRPYVWGLTAFGQEGVERVLDILRAELQRTMQQCGTPTIAQITSAQVQVAAGLPACRLPTPVSVAKLGPNVPRGSRLGPDGHEDLVDVGVHVEHQAEETGLHLVPILIAPHGWSLDGSGLNLLLAELS